MLKSEDWICIEQMSTHIGNNRMYKEDLEYCCSPSFREKQVLAVLLTSPLPNAMDTLLLNTWIINSYNLETNFGRIKF